MEAVMSNKMALEPLKILIINIIFKSEQVLHVYGFRLDESPEGGSW